MPNSDSRNRLLILAGQANRLPNLLVVVLIAPVLLYGGLILGSILGNLALGWLVGGGPVGAEIAFELRNVLSFGLLAVFLALWLRWFEGRKLWTLGLENGSHALALLTGWTTSVAIIAAVVALAALLGGANITFNATPLGGMTALLLLLVVIPSRFVQGGAEELLFRGWMMPVIGVRYSPWMGVVVSSVLFSMLHMLNAGFLPLAMLNLALIGLFLALYALREGGLWGVIALHAGLNWAQANLFGLPASGHVVGATLLNVELLGSTLITGGEFGIENGLAMTVVAAAAVSTQILLRKSRTKGGPTSGAGTAAGR